MPPCEELSPNILQSPMSGHQLRLIKEDISPETIHAAPPGSFSPRHPTHRAPGLSPSSVAHLFQERFITGLSTQSLPLRKKIKIRNTLQEDAVAKAKS